MDWQSTRSKDAGPSWSDRVRHLLMPSQNRTRNIWLYGAAALLPFGWILLVAQAVPVRALTRSLRSHLDLFHRP